MDGSADRLCSAAERGDLRALHTLLAEGVDVNARRIGGDTALLSAVAAGRTACVAFLLASGADLHHAHGSEMTALRCAASLDHLGCLELLLQGGAQVNMRSMRGISALYEAASSGSTACVAALLAAGADPLLADASGWNAVHAAAWNNHVDALRLLLAPAPELALRLTDDGRTPLACALHRKREDAARYLLAECQLPPVGSVLQLLAAAGAWAQPLFAVLAACQQLTAEQWALVPIPCAGVGSALLEVLQRSTAEAALLAQHLPPAEREHLQTTLLCFERMRHRHRLPALPSPLEWRLLLAAVT
ncbi:hypothetical protein ABPG75_009232 [Micractinium tetrahymenae]